MSDRGRARRVVAPRGRGRRSQADLAQLQETNEELARASKREYEADERKKKEAAIKAERLKARSHSNRRGRGGFMGDQMPSSGPLSLGSVIQPSRTQTYTRPWAPAKRGRTGAAKNFGQVKVEGSEGSQAQSQAQPSEPATYIDEGEDSDDSDVNDGRVSVDYINLLSEEEGDQQTKTVRPRAPAFAPVRVQRDEHRDRAPQINPEVQSSIKKQEDEVIDLDSIPPVNKKGKQRAKDVEIVGEKSSWRGVWQPTEPTVSFKQEASDDMEILLARPKPSIDREKTIKPRSKKKGITDPPAFQTEEDRKEWERKRNDLKFLVAELGQVDLETKVGDGVSETTVQAKFIDQKKDRAYLFQFPPVVPSLVDASKGVKSEPQDTSEPTTTAAGLSTAAPPAEGQVEEVITIKDDTEGKDEPHSNKAAHLPKLEPGRVGKLRVYKSGKTTLDWGGVSLQINPGVTPHFLQDCVMVKMHPDANSHDTTSSAARRAAPLPVVGEAMAFGQVRGKFIVTPDFEELLGGKS